MAKNIKVVPSLGIIQLSGSNANTSISVTDDGQLQFGESSNTGSLNVTGDLVVQGSVTAQEFKTEFVSASIVYRSGSTKFGDTSDDVHQFTGSLELSGSAIINAATNTNSYFFAKFRNSDDEDVIQFRTNGSADFNGSIKVNSNNNLGRVTVNPTTDSSDAIGIDERGFIAFADGGTLNTRFRGLPGGVFQFQDDAYTTFFNISKNGINYLNTSGNFGIGTTSPGSALDVNGTIRTNSTFQFYNTGGSVYAVGTYDASYYKFLTSGTERVRIDTSGNVGIGTTSPSDKLQVDGRVRIKSNSGLYIDTSGTYGASAAANFEVINDASSNPVLRILNSDNGGFRNISINTYGGKLGIGTLNPTTTLHIKGSGTSSSTTSLLVQNSNSSSSLWVTDDQIINARQLLIVNHITNANRSLRLGWGSIYATDTNNELTIGSVWGDSTTTRIHISGKNSDNTPSDAISMQANNGVAIYSGSSSDHFDPQALLHVSGSGIFTGNVGIGTSSPNYKLDVFGSGNFTDNLTVTGSALIQGVGNYADTNLQIVNASGDNVLKATNGHSITVGISNNNSIVVGNGAHVISSSTSKGLNFYSNTQNGFNFELLGLGSVVRIDNNTGTRGFMGLGTTTPQHRLDVSGSGNFTDGLTVTGSILHDGDLTVTGTVTAQEFKTEFVSASIIYQSGSTKFGDTSDDTHSFTGSLEVTGSVSVADNITLSTGGYIYGDTTDPYIRLNDTAGAYLGYGTSYIGVGGPTTIVDQGTTVIRFRNNRIVAAKNTLIGTSDINETPSARLQVRGSGTTSSTTAFRVENANASASLVVTDASLVQIANPPYTTSTAANFEGILLSNTAEIRSNSNSGGRIAGFRLYNPGTSTGALELYRAGIIATQLTSGESTINDVSFVTYGNFGLGTATPSQGKLVISSNVIKTTATSLLYVTGSTSQTYDLARFVSDETDRVVITNNGSVGIGTTSPAVPLHVSGTFRHDGSQYNIQLIGGSEIRGSNAVTLRGLSSYAAILAAGSILHTAGTDHIFRDTNSNALVTIKQAGNVGIGVNNPSDFNSSADNLVIGTGTGTNGISIYSGTDSAGGIYFADESGSGAGNRDGVINYNHSTATMDLKTGGNQRVLSLNTGTSTFHLGDVVMENDLTVKGIVTAKEFHTEFVSASIVYSSGSTKFGDTSDDIHQFTGSLEVSSSINSANIRLDIPNLNLKIGNTATLSSVTGAGQYNTAIGQDTGQNLTTGYNFTGLGYSAGKGYTTGNSNISLGNYTGPYFGTSNGAQNTLVGSTIGIFMTDGASDNTGVGGGSLYYNTSGASNTALGRGALQDNATGSYNTAVGRLSAANIKGDNNIAIGANSMKGVTLGSNNIVIGDLRSGVLGTTLNGVTAIGSGSRIDFYANSTGVGIGTTSPSAKLQVQGSLRVADTNYVQVEVDQTDSAKITMGVTSASTVGFIGVANNGGGHLAAAPQLKFLLNSTEVARFDENGNLGIGTTSPSNKLHVAQDLGSGGTLVHFNNTNATYSQNMYLSFNSSKDVTWSQGSSSGGTVFNTGTRGHSFQVNGTTNVVFNGSGNVGIGVTNVNARLHLSGSTGSSILRMDSPGANTLAFNHYTGYSTLRDITLSNNRLLFLDSGAITTPYSIGIGLSGATAPSSDLHIGSNNPVIQIGTLNTSTGNAKLQFYSKNDGTGNGYAIQYTKGTGVDRLDFIDGGGTAKVSFVNGGNVGIGTSSPSDKLHVVGDVIFGNESNQKGVMTLRGDNPASNTEIYAIELERENYNPGVANAKISFFRGGSGQDAEIAFFTQESNTAGLQERLRITEAGNVGIGTTTPSAKFHIFSDTHSDFLDNGILLEVSSSDEGEPAIAFRNQSDMGSNYWIAGINNGGGNLDFAYGSAFTSANTKVRFDSNGNVGIGTTSPVSNYKLHVVGSSRTALLDNSTLVSVVKITNSGTGNGTYNGLDFVANSTNSSNIKSHGMPLTIATSNTNGVQTTERMRITGDGNVGIGTTSPAAKLDVEGIIFSRGQFQLKGSSGSTTTYAVIQQNGTEGVFRLYNGSNWGFIARGVGNDPYIGAYREGSLHIRGFGQSDGDDDATDKDLATFDFATERVGIGTTSPQDLLHLSAESPVLRLTNTSDTGKSSIEFWDNQSGTSISGEVFYDDSSNIFGLQGNANGIIFKASNTFPGSELMRLTSSGRLGIGTTSPTRDLEIGTDGGGEKILKIHSDTASSYFEIQSLGNVARLLATNNTNLLLQSDGSGGYITFNANSAEHMRIAPSGNVGIGTTAPTHKLEVAGTVSGSAFYGDGQNLTNVQRIPKVEYQALTASIATNDVIGLPNGLNYTTSSNGYEYLEMFVDGIRLSRTLDYAEVSTSTVRYLLNVPSGSVVTYKSLTLV